MFTFVLWLAVVSHSAALSRGCNTRADIALVIDSSDTVGQIDFNKQIDFLKDVTNKLNVGRDQVHVSALTFSSGVHNGFYLKDHVAKSDVLHALSSIQYIPGNADTADAIKFMSQQSFSPEHGVRGDVPHIAVLLTDGPSTTKAITKLQAQTAKDNNAVIYTVGVGSGVDVDELTSVSSNPDLRYSMFADNYDTLRSLSDMLATKICNELPPDTSTLPVPTGCLHKADVVFMVDSSTSVGSEDFQKTQNFLKNIITNMDVGHDKVQVGVMQYSSYPTMGFPLILYNKTGDVLHAVENLHMISGGTNTADAIKFTTDEMFSATSGARSNVSRIAILLTNGGTVNSHAAINAADVARQAGIGVNVVSIGNNTNQQEINAIANQPAENHVVIVSNFDQLEQKAAQILNQACNVTNTFNFAASAAVTCADKIPNCREYGSSVCRDYPTWAETNCKNTCGRCAYQYTINFPTCTNKLTNCDSYGKAICTSHESWSRDNCSLYCGFCGAVGSSNGFYGMCNYKGKRYQTGEKWVDGCDYECVCNDGSKGTYKCYNRCPLYYNLPSMCTLVKKEGECCLQPVCNFNPSITRFNNTAMATTASGIPVCSYKSKLYFQGQTWKDSCQYQCTCTDASKGLYTCEQLCPTYPILPAGCHLHQAPGSCCQTPRCEFNQQQGSYTGYGFTSGNGTAQNVDPPQPCVDAATNCKVYGKSVCKTYAQWSSDNCRKYCGICQNLVVKPAAGDVCIYRGKTYQQGQTWEPDCSTRCTCENAHYGYYRCNEACPHYNNLPAVCNTVKREGCCPVVECQTGVFYTSSQNIDSIGNGGLITVQHPPANHIQNPPYGQTQIGSGGTGFMAPTLRGCLYNGQIYGHGQMWDDGCKYTCTCMNDVTGDYRCREKCPSYPNMTSTCVMITDTNDPCCKVPKCGFDVATGQIPIPVPSYNQTSIAVGIVKPPTPTVYPTLSQNTSWVILNTTGGQPVAPTAPANVKQGFCIYKGQRYSAGETWDDGCDYNCVCDDGLLGHYRCISKCRTFDYVPRPQCRLKQDPNNPCCQIPECILNLHNPEIEGQRTTPRVQGNYCMYNGKQYQQGQSWYDGCSYKCTCEDAGKGIYRCLSRCPEILNAEPGCNYITDPRDPTCCRVPDCTPVNITNPHPIPPKTYQGQIVGTSGKCVYKGSEYRAGESWEDGCDLTCICTDALRGHYECVDRCPVYTNLPDTCRMVNDFTNPCCKKPECNIPGQLGGTDGSKSTTTNPVLPQTLPPKQQYCVYKSAQYLQAQVWEDGCNYKCRCDDSSRGIYTCNQRCPTFSSLTPGCTLKTDPKDSCCLVEVCPQPTPGPHQTTPVPTILPKPFTGRVNLPIPSPVTGHEKPAPKPIGFCIYKSVIYTQGQKWSDGCDYICECYDADNGKYRCTPKCPSYIDLPTVCRFHKDPANPCCDIVECAELTTTPTQTTQPGPSNQAPNENPNPQTTTNITPTATPQSRCTCEYKGQQYIQGQQWFDGCDFSCVCEDCVTGVYRCNQRCPSFQTPHAECSLVADPKDPLCCKIPECPTAGNYNTAPPLVIQGGKATRNPTITLTPTALPPTPITDHVYTEKPYMFFTTRQPTPQTPPVYILNTCIYKGKSYTQGQRWQDGCDYDCVCKDQMTGVYKCTEKCPRITNLNPGCQLVQDINEPCCKKAFCPPNVSPIVIKPPTPTTLNGRPAVCTYKGMDFKQGETWKDGCDLVCICENGTTGFYRCDDRCAVYQLPNGCVMKTDPADSCCKKPVCQPELMIAPTVSPTPRPKPWVVPSPTPSPTPYTLPMPTGVNYGSGPNGGRGCLYKGVSYNVGQTWKDGCFYTCECLDMQTGRYRCKDRCPALDGVAPPPTCQIVSDPSDFCCKMLQCQYSTPVPTPTFNITTGTRPSIPGTNTTVKTSVSYSSQTTPEYTIRPTSKNACVMNGVTYTPGQTWYDGCTRLCVCEDGRTGYYRCRQRCNTYDSLPSSCTLVPDPKDPSCCQIPLCAIPTPGFNQSVTIKGQSGSFTGFGIAETLPPTPFLPNQQSTGLPQPSTTKSNVCGFNGLAYKTGERWQDGCKYTCVCEDGNMGRYKCTERCPAVPRLSPGCTLQTDPSDYCCEVAVCRQTTTPLPGRLTSPPTKPQTFCVYNGAPYTQGQTWQDGCSTTCRCDDADNNLYNCFDRCPHYPDLPAGCIKTADPNDPCCLVPVCNTPKPTTYNPLYPTTTANPNRPTTPYNPYVTPLPKGEIVGYNPITQNTYNISPKPTYCVYKGKKYTNNQTWQDGCDYNCECIDQATGRYRCTERCPTFPVQSNCFMVPSQTDDCCRVQYCPPPTPGTTLVPNPEQSTTVPLIPIPQPSEICIYDGKRYTQGQAWYDGCDQKCVCDNGKTGHYTCIPRCLQYQAGSQCIMVPDPQDPSCCMVPQCPQSNTVYPVIVGIQTPTTPTIALTTPIKTVVDPNGSVTFGTTPILHMCVYKGQMYQQGQKWQDGCDYFCECVNSTTGKYQCTERCPNSNQIPLTCQLKYNPDDPCCPLPDCPSIISPSPGSNVAPTVHPPPIPAFCVYNGVPYRQGQSWDVDCEKICRCDDARNSLINCDERCPSYPPPKPGCRLVTDPSDQCCQSQICIDINSTNPFTVVSGSKGTFTGMPKQPVSGQPSISQIYGTMMCVYRGKAYSQGQKWDDGCQFQCECIDQQAGRYKCTERCTRHPQVPSYCTLTQDPNDACCQSVYCPIQPTAAPIRPGEVTHGVTNHFKLPPPLAICVYNRQAYRQDQEWFDGCDKKCVCVNAKTGYYRCQQRCNVYTHVSSGCMLVPDPSDPTCCKAPSCPVVQPGAPPITGLIKPLQTEKGTITGNATPPPEPVTINVNGNPHAGTNGNNVTPNPRRGCFFKDTIYRRGDKWQDGCEYTCECMDDMNGRYKCTERCQKFPNLPYYCVLVQDQSDHCCGIPYCGNPNNTAPLGNIPTQFQIMSQTTPTYINPNQPRPFSGTKPSTQTNGYCVYKGVYYRQGQTWSDGCDKICTCDDVINNLFSCRTRCPQFNHIPDTCHLVADQNDPCCLVPDCNTSPSHPFGYSGSTTPRPVYYLTPVINPGFSGQSNVGPNNPLSTLINGTTGVCVYKGKIYQQNQKWQDGCKLTCQCLDALRGQYKCIYTCPQYYNLPWYCTYEQDPNNTCCQRVRCDESEPNTTQTTVTIPPLNVTTTQETTIPSDMCRYTDNTVHVQGATWDDGCNYRCICIDAKINYYRCSARCRVYSGLPSYCTLATDPADICCKIPKCNSGTITLQPVYTNMSGSSTPPPNALNVVPIGSHNTIYGSHEVRPGAVNPFISAGGYHACIYKGSVYKQGDSWQDGCNYVCTCDNAQNGEYKCVSRCPIYPSTLPTYCIQVAIPGQCCPKLSCDIPGTNGSYVPQSEVRITPAPTNPGGLVVTPAEGNLHVQGSYTIATNAPHTMTTAFLGQGFPISQSQIASVRAQCIFPTKNGQQYAIYNEGEQWSDGCDYTCTCKDGASGYYECISSCPTYNNLESSRCYMVRIDGKCCSEPRCMLANGQVVDPMKVQTSFPIVPSFSGGYVNFRPDKNYTALETGGVVVRNVCIYKGRQYHQGQLWNDGCDFDCRCDDASTGQFSCTPRCPVYTEMPSFCSLDTIAGECCKKLNCPHVVPSGITTTPKPMKPSCDWCKDTLSTCESYGHQACVDPYIPWAKRNCANYCNLCQYDCTHPPPIITTSLPDSQCHNELDNCEDYGKDSCTGIFKPWARKNCQAFCGYCNDTALPNSTCRDVSPVCSQMDSNICTSIVYKAWAQTNCMKTCNHLCSQQSKSCRYTDGVTHEHGSWWQDGCSADAKNCTCNNGIVKCLKLCHSIENLPSGWQVERVTGKCCPIVKPPIRNACHYNGTSYEQDQSWRDGCRLSCKCTNAQLGMYQCNELCPQLNLPDVCHWEKRPNKCCRKPICPDIIVIQGYPDV